MAYQRSRRMIPACKRRPKPTIQIGSIQLLNQSKNPTAQTHRSRFNHYLQPKSLQDIKNDIYSTSNDANPHTHPPKHKHRLHRATFTMQEFVPKSTHPWQQAPTITGVSAQVSIGIKSKEPPHFQPVSIKLSRVINLLRNVEYKPEEFVAIRMKLKNPMITVNIFSNGTLTILSGKSQYSCTVALRKVARMLQQLDGYTDKIEHITEPIFYGVHGNARLGQKIDLQKMSEAFPRRVEYSTDIESSCLKFRDPLKYGDKGSCRVFHSGSVTVSGVASVKNCITWLEDMYVHCKDYFINEDTMDMDGSSNYRFSNVMNADDHTDNNASFNGTVAPPFNGIDPPPLLN
eukprot:89932_1